jgi:chitin disaccharide deacetylase
MNGLFPCLPRLTAWLAASAILLFSLPVRGDDNPQAERLLIIHADDAGMSHSVNQATIAGLEQGIVSSCSIMVPCPWFPEFAEYARTHPERDFGIHLTLNSEFSNLRWGSVAGRSVVPSLVDADGCLHKSKDTTVANARPAEVELELRAQIDKALQAGIRLSHLDTHMGTVISTPDMLEIYVRLGLDYDLPVMMIRRPDPIVLRGYPALAEQGPAFVNALEGRALPVIDHLFQFYDGSDHDARKQRYLDTFRKLQPGVTQMIIHCGYDNEELQAITGSHFLRGDDTRIFTDPDVKGEIERMGIRIVSWSDLRRDRQGVR